jgi:hypothetical protein
VNGDTLPLNLRIMAQATNRILTNRLYFLKEISTA